MPYQTVWGQGEIAKLLDFGIVKMRGSVAGEGTGHTKTGAALGTSAYMSPEQAGGEHDLVDHRTDQWALAVVVYQALSGELPYGDGELLETVKRIREGQHRPLSDRVPGLPPEVYGAVERALSRDRDQRFADIAAFVRQLHGEIQPPPPARRRGGLTVAVDVGAAHHTELLPADAPALPPSTSPPASLPSPPAAAASRPGRTRPALAIGVAILAGAAAGVLGTRLTAPGRAADPTLAPPPQGPFPAPPLTGRPPSHAAGDDPAAGSAAARDHLPAGPPHAGRGGPAPVDGGTPPVDLRPPDAPAHGPSAAPPPPANGNGTSPGGPKPNRNKPRPPTPIDPGV